MASVLLFETLQGKGHCCYGMSNITEGQKREFILKYNTLNTFAHACVFDGDYY